jgi:DNA ligase-1
MSQVQHAFDALEYIESTTSRTEKESGLKATKDNDVLKQLLLLTYNPFVIFGIKKDPKVVPDTRKTDYDVNYHKFLSLLTELSQRRVTGHRATHAVVEFFTGCDATEYKWYMKVLQKDLKIGITDKTVNKIHKGLIPSFTCALANSFGTKLPKRYVSDPKLDGYRCLAFNYGGVRGVELRSRNGHPIEGYLGIEKDLADYVPDGFVYDGEIMARSGLFSDVQKSAFKKGVDDKDGVLNIFDAVTIEEFETGDFKVPYEGRLAYLNQLDRVFAETRSLERVYHNVVLTDSEEDKAVLFAIHIENVLKGYEGTMIKDLDALYKKDKSNNILKMKDFYAIDLEITGVYEGKAGTQFEGTMGGVTVNVSDTDIIEQCPVDDPKHTKKLQYITGGCFEVGVGSGWNKPDRDKYWANPNLLIGKTLEISFQETSLNEKGEHSLRFPTVVKVRDDK